MNQKGIVGLQVVAGAIFIAFTLSVYYFVSQHDQTNNPNSKDTIEISQTVKATITEAQTDNGSNSLSPTNSDLQFENESQPTLEITRTAIVDTANLTLGGEWNIELEYPTGWKTNQSVKSSNKNGVSQKLSLVQFDPDTNDFEDNERGVLYMEILYGDDERLSETHYSNNKNASSYSISNNEYNHYCYELNDTRSIECVFKRDSQNPFIVVMSDLEYKKEYNLLLASITQK